MRARSSPISLTGKGETKAMTLFDEYCYNLMEAALKKGAEGSGLSKEECVAYMNIMFGARGAEEYIKGKKEEREAAIINGETMGD